MKAYVRTDALELSEVVNDLKSRLDAFGIQAIQTSLDWKAIKETEPFLYFRTPYLRLDNEGGVLTYHLKNPHIPYLATMDGELVSISPSCNIKDHPFLLNSQSGFYLPQLKPLPILLGTSQRSVYLKLTLNSLMYNIKDKRQKLYLVISQPDSETLLLIEFFLKKYSNIQAVLVESNLKYAFANFGSKYFNLRKFIHFEDDGILPENTHHLLPYWPSQLTYRSETADLTCLRVQEYLTTNLLKSNYVYRSQGVIKIPEEIMWFYTKYDPDFVLPVGGLGMVIDSESCYKDFEGPRYCKTDINFLFKAKKVCIGNIPIYHLGSNQRMDYPDYVEQKKELGVNRYQFGKDMRTQETRRIDLQADWKQQLHSLIK